MRRLFYLPLFLLAVVVGTTSASAQQTVARPPAIAFDISGKTLSESKLVKSIPMPPNAQMNVLDARRLFGAISVPESIAALAQFQPGGELPVELLIVGEFDNNEDRQKMISDAQLENSETVQLNGKDYYVEPNVGNMHLLLEEKKIEIGSKDYLLTQRPALLTAALKAAMGEMGKAPFKLAIDMEQDRAFFVEAVDMAKQQGVPPMMLPFLDLPKKINLLTLSIDPNSDEMLKLTAKTSKPSDAKFVANAIDGLLGIAKMGYAQAPKEMPGVELYQAISANTKTSIKDNDTFLIIKKPAGFDELLQKTMAQAGEMNKKMMKANNLKQLLLTMHNYESVYSKVPFNHDMNGRASLELSWRVRVLPYLEQLTLYQQFQLDEAWDSENNKPLAEKMPETYGTNGKTPYCWIESDVQSFAQITDGLSNTIAIIESTELVPWTEAKDISIEAAEKMILGLPDGQEIYVGMYDGSVRKLSNKVPADKLHAMLTPNGGEAVDTSDF